LPRSQGGRVAPQVIRGAKQREVDDAAAQTEADARATAWEEVNQMATETAVWVPWSWDEDLLVFSEDAVNAYYHSFATTIDWVNTGVQQ
jgi:hypothetical protein